MDKRYHHTQIGYLTMVALGAGLLFMIGLILTNGFEGVVLGAGFEHPHLSL